MISKSFARSKRLRCATRAVRSLVKFVKVQRSKTERRSARILLKLGQDDVPSTILAKNHVGHAAWIIS